MVNKKVDQPQGLKKPVSIYTGGLTEEPRVLQIKDGCSPRVWNVHHFSNDGWGETEKKHKSL